MKFQLLLAVFCLLSAISCKKAGDLGNSEYSIGLDECESVRSGGDRLTICTDQLNDSRCPEGAVCGWAGIAYAKFTITVNNVAHTFTMAPKAFPSYSNLTDTTIDGFRIEFLDILPHRRTNDPFPVNQEAKVKITHP
jgi:hypothetical protein